jgi:hypothetical protein
VQTVCTEAFCTLEVENSDSGEEDGEERHTSLGLSNLDSPALQVRRTTPLLAYDTKIVHQGPCGHVLTFQVNNQE